MGRPKIELTGKIFGKLTVREYVGTNKDRRAMWLCDCECGGTRIVSQATLKKNKNISCGCTIHRREIPYQYKKKRLYVVWQGMKKRCFNKNEFSYYLYGGRGITVCPEWRDDYKAFERWAIANGYEEDAPRGECTLDRIDVNGNYKPSNCRWISNREQSLNRRTNREVWINGEKYYPDELSLITGMSRSAIISRLNQGWSIEETLTKDLDKCRKVDRWKESLENFGFLESLTNMSLKYRSELCGLD